MGRPMAQRPLSTIMSRVHAEEVGAGLLTSTADTNATGSDRTSLAHQLDGPKISDHAGHLGCAF
jgi:hypothetical protein